MLWVDKMHSVESNAGYSLVGEGNMLTKVALNQHFEGFIQVLEGAQTCCTHHLKAKYRALNAGKSADAIAERDIDNIGYYTLPRHNLRI